jgi:RPA family protein|tara:strand:- start:245 stop:880 length:636 start_codon:yes stop_codon:yes gene_type:complete
LPEAEQKFQKRQTAYKIRIKDILNFKYIKTEGFDPNYLEIQSQEISRINIMGVVIQKSRLDNYKTLVIDDSTGKISARIFENKVFLDKIEVGDIVLVIGRPREFSSEKYILIETIKKIDPAWTKVRELELEKNIAEHIPITKNKIPVKESIVDLNPTNKIIKLIKELDKGNGVSIEELSSKNIEGIDKMVDVLLKEGDVFEIKPGRLKVLE